jgi:hypothetical protein
MDRGGPKLMSNDQWDDKIDKVNELENEIQSLHNSIKKIQIDLKAKTEQLRNLKDPNRKEREEQQKVKTFLENAHVNFEEWEILKEGSLKGAYIHHSHTFAIATTSQFPLKESEYTSILLNYYQLREIVKYFEANEEISGYFKLYLSKDLSKLNIGRENILALLAPCVSDEDEEEEEEKETVK